jgi:hypothetical protein
MLTLRARECGVIGMDRFQNLEIYLRHRRWHMRRVFHFRLNSVHCPWRYALRERSQSHASSDRPRLFGRSGSSGGVCKF